MTNLNNPRTSQYYHCCCTFLKDNNKKMYYEKGTLALHNFFYHKKCIVAGIVLECALAFLHCISSLYLYTLRPHRPCGLAWFLKQEGKFLQTTDVSQQWYSKPLCTVESRAKPIVFPESELHCDHLPFCPPRITF